MGVKDLATTVNRMPMKTWNRLGVNDADLVLRAPAGTPHERPSALAAGVDASCFFAPAQMQAFINKYGNRRRHLFFPKGYVADAPTLIEMHLDGETPAIVDDIVIEASEDARAAVVIVYTSEAGLAGSHCGRTRVLAHPGALVEVATVQMLSGESAHTHVIGGTVREGARLKVIMAELGAETSLSSCNVVLEGKESATEVGVAYLGDGTRALDMSCRMEIRGERSTADLKARGVLLEQSKKVFRDTLDFVSGAIGARGREEETVLMLSPEVHNVSVPVLLCGEDDVEGEHAATSGRPDEDVLFYLMSRGLSEMDAKAMLAEAAVSSIVEGIPDDSVRRRILGLVHESIKRAGQPG